MNQELKLAYEMIDSLSYYGSKEAAMFQVFFDESGTHRGAPLTVVAGWIGDRETWKSFIEEWSFILKESKIEYFHAKDPECAPLWEPLYTAILSRRLIAVAWTVDPFIFRKIASQRFMSRFGNEYSTCAYCCAGLVSELAHKLNWDSVALVYENRQPDAIKIHETISAMMNERVDHRFASIDFLNKEHPGSVPLQTADFLAHLIGTNQTAWIKRIEDSGRLAHPIVSMPPEKLEVTVTKIERIIKHDRQERKNSRKKMINS